MNQAINEEPDVLGAEVARVLANTAPREKDIRLLQNQLLARHCLLPALKRVVSSEEVVESFFRCVIVHHIQQRYQLGTESLPTCINSSHRAVRGVCALPDGHYHIGITDDAWSEGWRQLQDERSGVNIMVPTSRSPRRADLYVIARNKIVSLEFKYIGSKGLRDAASVAAQIRLHANNHALAILLLYCGASVEVKNDAIARLQPKLPANARILNVQGPEILVAK